ncbi:dihydroorotate dehydrogenase 1A [Basidiobolus meristosporus CBS 931.73]|uniref:Dihydroorotate dehydrogenase (fumarate) n=1 Tax=Basidiobolus meristosporus CBS 931.73 TaxID=1314790 RepID=A0A1Y1XKB6_9FUNG|nr:dihydroorotate dehydrogenase 1A [Basidiobolus meristosporus CBS 931.73]|eukprot:ORX86155.1 dihydroorotate dehydrogenase 1A [Basidiobolus meristosporus CBS 931.73]
MMDISTELLGQNLDNPLMNASGVHCRSYKELEELMSSAAGSLVTKSATIERRMGNPEPRYSATPLGSINSMGLPNEGYEYYLEYAKKHDYKKKPLFVSLAGLSLEDNLKMVLAFKETGLPCILEVNFSCPNVPGKPQLGYDIEAMERALHKIAEAYGKPFGVKLPPYFDIAHFDQVAEVLNGVELVEFVTCINSIGNALVVDTESESVVIKPKNGFGGIGGDYVLPTALANVNAFYRRCPKKKVIGCGGVKSGNEVFQHILCGASIVQIGTALYEEGPELFERVTKEFQEIMQRKGYNSLKDFRGKVKTM